MMTLDVGYWSTKHLHGKDVTRTYLGFQLGSKEKKNLNISVQVTDMNCVILDISQEK